MKASVNYSEFGNPQHEWGSSFPSSMLLLSTQLKKNPKETVAYPTNFRNRNVLIENLEAAVTVQEMWQVSRMWLRLGKNQSFFLRYRTALSSERLCDIHLHMKTYTQPWQIKTMRMYGLLVPNSYLPYPFGLRKSVLHFPPNKPHVKIFWNNIGWHCQALAWRTLPF